MRRRRLDIVGFGIGGPANVTLGANKLVAETDCIFTLVGSRELPSYMDAVGKSYKDLMPCYKVGRSAAEVYKCIVDEILHDRNWRRAVFFVEGNPQLYNTPVRRLKDIAKKEEWEVVIHPAISSFDALLIDLNLHIEDSGLQILDAGRMLVRELPVSPKLGCLLLQLAGCTLNSFMPVDSQDESVFTPLRQWLTRFYPKEHQFIIVRSAVHSNAKSRMIHTTISSFPEYAREIDYNCSAYIPPVENAE